MAPSEDTSFNHCERCGYDTEHSVDGVCIECYPGSKCLGCGKMVPPGWDYCNSCFAQVSPRCLFPLCNSVSSNYFTCEDHTSSIHVVKCKVKGCDTRIETIYEIAFCKDHYPFKDGGYDRCTWGSELGKRPCGDYVEYYSGGGFCPRHSNTTFLLDMYEDKEVMRKIIEESLIY